MRFASMFYTFVHELQNKTLDHYNWGTVPLGTVIKDNYD